MSCARFDRLWGRKFLILSINFRYLIIISPWNRPWSFIWRKLNPLHPRILFAKIGWNWSSSFKEHFQILPMYFLDFVVISIDLFWTYFIVYIHIQKVWTQVLTTNEVLTLISIRNGHGSSFEQMWITFTQGCFGPSLVKIGPVVYEKKIFKIRKYIIISHLKRVCPFHRIKLNPSIKKSLFQVWLKFAQWFWRARWKFKKYRETDRRTTDNRRTEKLNGAFSSGELKGWK